MTQGATFSISRLETTALVELLTARLAALGYDAPIEMLPPSRDEEEVQADPGLAPLVGARSTPAPPTTPSSFHARVEAR